MRTLIRECIHDSGDYREIDCFPVRKPNSSRKAKAKPSTNAQKILNQKNAARRLTWLIQDNFGTNDYFLTLTYPLSFEGNEKMLNGKLFENWFRRIRRIYKKQGVELKYISSTELGEDNKRLHHHLIISGGIEDNATVLKNEWNRNFNPCKKGYAHIEHMKFTRMGAAALAHYQTKNPRLFYRSYTCSKNLRHRPPTNRDGRISGKKLKELRADNFNRAEFEKLYPGYEFVDADPHLELYDIDINGEATPIDFPYLTVRMFKKDSKYILRDEERT